MAVAASVGFVFTSLIFRLFLSPPVAIRCAFGFVAGGGAGAALSLGMLALLFGAGTTLTSGFQVIAYLSTVAIGGLIGASALCWLLMQRFPVP
jgi:hypothetical protein